MTTSSGRGGRRTRRRRETSASPIRVTPAASSSRQNGRSRSCSGSEGQTSASSTSLRTSNSAARTTAFETIKMFEPHLMNVYSAEPDHQAGRRIRAQTPGVAAAWSSTRCSIWDGRGIDFPHIMDALGEIGYEGYVTVHQASAGVQGGPAAAITENARYLRSIGDFEE